MVNTKAANFKMKIMHFISGVKSGGVEQMLVNYTEKINQHKNVVEYIIYQHSPNKVSLKKLNDAGNICIRVADKRTHPIKNFIETYSLIKKYNPDIIHAHMNLLNFLPLFAGKLNGVKIRISHSHIAHINISSRVLEKIFKFLNVLTANFLLSCGTKAGQYMYGNNRYIIIPNSIDVPQFVFNSEMRLRTRKKLGINQHDILLGNIGRLTEQKNQMFLLDILRRLKTFEQNYKLVIIGSGEKKVEISKMIRDYGLDKDVLLVSPIKNVANLYDAMDVFLLPSLYEGFPVSAIEAQVSGLPTILSSEIDKSAKIIESTKFDNIDMANDWVKDISKCHIKNNRQVHVESFSQFNIENTYTKLYDLYKELFKNGGRKS